VPLEQLKVPEETTAVSNDLSLLLCAVDGNVRQMTYPLKLTVSLMSEERFWLNQLEQYFEPAAWEQLTDCFTAALLVLDDSEWKWL